MLITETATGEVSDINKDNSKGLMDDLTDLVLAKVQPQQEPEKWRLVAVGLRGLGIELKDISELTEDERVQL